MAGKSQWGPDTRTYICEQLSIGRSLLEICREPDMPSDSLVRLWAVKDIDGFAADYARAREAGMDAMVDELLAIADDSTGDFTKTEDGREVVDHEAINRSRLRVDARKWIMSKIAPKKYGERLDLNHSGHIERLSESAVDAKIAALVAKAGLAGATGGEGPDNSDDEA